MLHVTHHKFTLGCWRHAFEWLIRTHVVDLTPAGRMERYRLEYEAMALQAVIRGGLHESG